MLRLVLVLASASAVSALAPTNSFVRPGRGSFGARSRVVVRSDEGDGRGVSGFDGGGVPSDSSTDDEELAAAAAAGELSSDATTPSWGPATVESADIPALKAKLLAMAAATARGEAASASEKDEVREMVFTLESAMDPATASYERDMLGTWELVFSDTQLFRSSPFFMAGRAVCKDGQEADQYDWFCDQHRAALGMSQIKRVRQVVSETQLVSEFEVSAGTVPFIESVPIPFGGIKYSGGLPFAITGSIVSSADIVEKMDDLSIKLLMDTVEIKGSNIPGLRNLLDTVVRLESRALGNALEQNIDSYENPTPIFRTTYLDGETRVSRDQDGKIFVYSKTSSSMVPTDYSSTAADLGLGEIVSGLTRAFL